MTLGKLNECWCCYERKRYENPDLKQICTPIRANKNSLLAGSIAWVCGDCRKDIKS